MNETIQTIHDRISANHFDPTKSLTEDEIKDLVAYATQAPSSFNIQHWRFIAVTDAGTKQALMGAAYGQPKVGDAPVTFVILGDLEGHTKLRSILDQSVAAGLVPANLADGWVGMATGMYGNNPQLARDEAIRSGSLAAMTLMLAAAARGLVSGPMIGFDPAQVKQVLGISDQYVPVMLLPVGHPAPGNTARKPRLTVDEVLAFNHGRQF